MGTLTDDNTGSARCVVYSIYSSIGKSRLKHPLTLIKMIAVSFIVYCTSSREHLLYVYAKHVQLRGCSVHLLVACVIICVYSWPYLLAHLSRETHNVSF